MNPQSSFIPVSELRSFKQHSFGGLKKRRKSARPLIPGAITHLVLKSSKAKGEFSFYKNKALVHILLKSLARKYFVEIKDFVNMGNHLHLKIRFKDKRRFQSFLRLFSGLLARRLTDAHRGRGFGRFWDGPAYTRVLTTKFEQLRLKIYFEGNHRERELGYQERVNYLKAWNEYLYKLRRA